MDLNKVNALSNKIIGLAIEVHRNLGPGLLEATYQQCLAYELSTNGINFVLEHPIPLKYKDINIDCSFRADVIVADCIILELKAIDKILPIHEAQLMTYLKITGIKLGLIINFNVKTLKEGIKRIIL